MKFLMEYGFTSEDIDKIIGANNESIIRNIEVNVDNVRKVLDYLIDIGINTVVIKDLFLEQIGIFFRTKEEIQGVFEEYEMESIIKSLNYDVNTVDLIEFS